eukprot:1806451-Prymnesium_polylepis.1
MRGTIFVAVLAAWAVCPCASSELEQASALSFTTVATTKETSRRVDGIHSILGTTTDAPQHSTASSCLRPTRPTTSASLIRPQTPPLVGRHPLICHQQATTRSTTVRRRQVTASCSSHRVMAKEAATAVEMEAVTVVKEVAMEAAT